MSQLINETIEAFDLFSQGMLSEEDIYNGIQAGLISESLFDELAGTYLYEEDKVKNKYKKIAVRAGAAAAGLATGVGISRFEKAHKEYMDKKNAAHDMDFYAKNYDNPYVDKNKIDELSDKYIGRNKSDREAENLWNIKQNGLQLVHDRRNSVNTPESEAELHKDTAERIKAYNEKFAKDHDNFMGHVHEKYEHAKNALKGYSQHIAAKVRDFADEHGEALKNSALVAGGAAAAGAGYAAYKYLKNKKAKAGN